MATYIHGRKYNLHSKYKTYEEALKTAKYYRKRCKARSFILRKNQTYYLYLTKVYRFWQAPWNTKINLKQKIEW